MDCAHRGQVAKGRGRAEDCPPPDGGAALMLLPRPDGGQGTARPTFPQASRTHVELAREGGNDGFGGQFLIGDGEEGRLPGIKGEAKVIGLA